MNYIKYEVNFLPLFYVQSIKISVYVENLHNFNFSFWECIYKTFPRGYQYIRQMFTSNIQLFLCSCLPGDLGLDWNQLFTRKKLSCCGKKIHHQSCDQRTQPSKKAKVQSFCDQGSWLLISPDFGARLPWKKILEKIISQWNCLIYSCFDDCIRFYCCFEKLCQVSARLRFNWLCNQLMGSCTENLGTLKLE